MAEGGAGAPEHPPGYATVLQNPTMTVICLQVMRRMYICEMKLQRITKQNWYLVFCSLVISVQAQTPPPANVYVDGVHGVSNSTCCPGEPTTPCKNLTIALACVQVIPLSMPVSITVNKGAYVLMSDSNLTVISQRTGGFVISGNCSLEVDCVKIICEQDAGLTFIKSDSITLENLTFTGCGHPNNSTSRDFSYGPKPHFLQVKSALYFLLCRTVTLSQVTVQHTDGTGVVMYSTVGENVITHSRFIENKPNANGTDAFKGGGGLYVEFAFCYPGNASCFSSSSNIPLEYTSGANYYIRDSIFTGNLANMSDSFQFTFILPQKSNHIAFGRGGGLSVFFKGLSSNNTVTIDGSRFVNNSALWGSGVFVEYQDFSYNNTFIVNNSVVTGNECLYKNSSSQGTGGGGARAGYIFFDDTHVKENSVEFENCTFSNNFAFFGGGVSFYAAREPTESRATNTLSFMNTTWQNNVARAGSAVDLSVWHSVSIGAAAVANFTNCRFCKNSGLYTKQPNTVVGIGALYLDTISVYLMGENWFETNTHSALAAVSTGIYLTTNSSVHFINNTGRHGAALVLFGNSFLHTSRLSRAVFINNTASISGGAIYQLSSGQHDLINSRNCFIRYSDITVTPDEWGSSFFFSGNRANNRNESIHATSLLICQWGGAFGNSSANLSRVFCWSNVWNYAGSDCSTEVRTSPAYFRDDTNFTFDIIPGQRQALPLKMLDDRGNDVTSSSVFLARSLSNRVYIDPGSRYISDNHIEVHTDYVRRENGDILLETIDPRVIQATFNVSVLTCPPGMVAGGWGNTSSCQCGSLFDGMIECNATGFYTRLQRGSWIGMYSYEDSQKVVASSSPYYFYSKSNELFLTLPNDTRVLDNFLCHKIHRTGTLCGKCLDGYGPALHTLDCIHCDARYMWAYYILTQYLPLTILFIAVIVLDIRVTAAPANAFIFFAQVLPTVFSLDGGGAILLKNSSYNVYTVLYDIWNLQFFEMKICLSPHLSSLQALSITYLEAGYPLVLIGLVSLSVWLYEKGFRCMVCVFRPVHIMLARFQQRWNIQRSLIHAFASFILLAYSRFILVSFYLLTTTPLTTDDGGTFGPPYGIVYYDGTIPYLSLRHAPFVVLALLVLISFVAVTPALLLVPSFSHNVALIRKRWPKLAGFIPNTERWTNTFFNWPKLTSFLEAFHGCYKDGTYSTTNQSSGFDYRWCAGYYLVLRVIIFAVYAFTPEWFSQYSFLQFLCISGVLLFTILRPYKKDLYNKLDATMFCLLICINTLTMFNYNKTAIGYQPSLFAFCVQYVMVLLPLVYISMIVSKYLWHCALVCLCHKGQCHDIDEEREGLIGHSEYAAQEGSCDYLTFMQRTGRLRDVNVYRPASSASKSSAALSEHQPNQSGDTTTSTSESNISRKYQSTDANTATFSSGASNAVCTTNNLTQEQATSSSTSSAIIHAAHHPNDHITSSVVEQSCRGMS